MKKFVFTLIAFVMISQSNAQKLSELYNSSAVRLVPDYAFGVNTNWDLVFSESPDSIHGKPANERRSMDIMPNGSVLVNGSKHNEYVIVNTDGSLGKGFILSDKNGQSFKNTIKIQGVLGGGALFSDIDDMGNLRFFDLRGKYIKSLKLDYSVKQIIALTSDKMAVVGWAVLKNNFRDFVAIVDINTNDQKVIWEHLTTRPEVSGKPSMFNYRYTFKSGGMIGFCSMPFSGVSGMSTPPILNEVNSNLVMTIPSTGEILVYTSDGKKLYESKVPWPKGSITAEEQKIIQKKAIEEYRGRNTFFNSKRVTSQEMEDAIKYLTGEMEKDLAHISEPIPLPFVSTIIKDSEGNLLMFEYPEEANANRFHVWIYGKAGKFDGACSLLCDDFDLQINPAKLAFYNNKLYGIQRRKGVKESHLSVVRFNLVSQ